jgi:hypothetical protein
MNDIRGCIHIEICKDHGVKESVTHLSDTEMEEQLRCNVYHTHELSKF